MFGGTSPAGIAFCLAALRDSHNLTLYMRNASKIPTEIYSNAAIITGELNDAAAIERAVSCGATTCVSFLGPVLGSGKRGFKPITNGYELILPLLQKYNYIRALFVSTASYRAPQDNFSLFFALMVWSVYLLFRAAYDEINGFTPLVAKLPVDNLKWTVFRVPLLMNGEAKPVKAGFVGGDVGLSVDRKALAEWVLREMDEGKWVGRFPAVSNA
jgi:hypothetical protein